MEGLVASSLFDHLVGEREQLRRRVEAERLGGLEIDEEFILGGCWTGRSLAYRP